MRLQVFSDLHLEFGNLDLPDSNADVVIAAGDIALGTDSIRWLNSLGKPVVFVAGNHDYWHGDMLERITDLRAESRFTNVHYLENEACEIGGVRFLGCTLWTDYNDQDPQVMGMAEMAINDFRNITLNNRPMCAEDLAKRHDASKGWLARQLSKRYEGSTVVVTHHAPTRRSWYPGVSNDLSHAYCNNLNEWMADFNIDLWVHGHVHKISDYWHGDTRIVCNPRGYYNYQETKGFILDKVVEI